jgi:hypothetical protein
MKSSENAGQLILIANTIGFLRRQLEFLEIQGSDRTHHLVRKQAVALIPIEKNLEDAAYYEKSNE